VQPPPEAPQAPASGHWQLPSAPGSVRAARAAVEEFLGTGHPLEHRDAAVLVVSELVANAVVHGGGSRPIELTVRMDTAGLCIEVEDGDPHPPVRITAGRDQDRGRGLMIVDTMAERWGWVPLQAGGKRVWCQVHEPGSGPAGGGRGGT
jgi:anti-sigma regulatory factor (Ser/Thr protein kinase)